MWQAGHWETDTDLINYYQVLPTLLCVLIYTHVWLHVYVSCIFLSCVHVLRRYLKNLPPPTSSYVHSIHPCPWSSSLTSIHLLVLSIGARLEVGEMLCSCWKLCVQFSAPTSGGSQLSVTPAPDSQCPSVVSTGNCIHTHIIPEKCTCIYIIHIHN